MRHSRQHEVAGEPMVDQPIGYVSIELTRNPNAK
jgi:hypothetical protein